MTRTIATALAALGIVLSPACSSQCVIHRTAECSELPAVAIDSFIVTAVTGDDSSDANINFCIRTKSRATEICRPLVTPRDDFELNAVDMFEVPLSVEAGELHSFFIENTGGAIFGNNEWQMVGLTVEAVTVDGDIVIYDEPGITCANDIDVGDTYQPMACTNW